VTESLPIRPAFQISRVLTAFILGVAGHVVALVAGFIAGRLTKPNPGGGFEDLVAVVSTFFGIEVLIALTCLIAGILLLVKGRRDLGAGLLLGWLLGGIAIWIFIAIQSAS
jgi:hypothetical protein